MVVKIVIDPGHGGKDSGAIGYGLYEKHLVLTIAHKVANILRDYNCSVKLTRTGDTFLSLTERANIANKWGADLMLSIHINASGSAANGYEDFRFTTASQTTQNYHNAMHEEIMKAIGPVTDRGKKSQNFAVLRQTKMPAILTENLFITNKNDSDKLKSDAFLDKVAQGHANGIIRIFNLKSEKPSKTSPAKPTSKPATTSHVGKRLESITIEPLNFYVKPSWDKKDVFGTISKGQGFPTVVSKHKVGTAYQYKVKNSKGKIYYITASPTYIKLV